MIFWPFSTPYNESFPIKNVLYFPNSVYFGNFFPNSLNFFPKNKGKGSFVVTHTAQYAYSSDRSCIRTLPPHTAPTRAVCVSDLRIQLLVALCVGMVHMIFSGSSKGTHTAPCCAHKSFRTHVSIPPTYEVYIVYSFRHFNHHNYMCLCIFVVLAHLNQRLICEIGYSGPLSSVRPSVNIFKWFLL